MASVFSLLDYRLQGLLKKYHITTPTKPQNKAIPIILEHKHVLLIAPTGLGKTEAALLPLFHHFLQSQPSPSTKRRGISILYITPLRALNRDMLRRTITWGEELGIQVAVRHGDTPKSERAKLARSPPDMLITTPETLQILFTGKRIRRHLQLVQWVVIDEIHELAVDERGAQLSVALERLTEVVNQHRFQRIGLSATVGLPEEVKRYLGGKKNNQHRPVTVVEVDVTKHIDITVELPTVQKSDYPKAQQLNIEPLSFALLRRCHAFIDHHVSTLLFINTRDGAEILASRFHRWKQEFSIGVHHGSLSKATRVEAENDFKSGKLKGLICTSSLELGIDVGDTDFVIQYNSPRQVTRLLQRVGRSGHQVGKTSRGVVLASTAEDHAESVIITKKALNGRLEKIPVRMNPLSVLSNQIISIALEYGKIASDTVYQLITRAYPFHRLARSTFDTLVQQLRNQRSIWVEEEEKTTYLMKRANSRKYFLENISMIPDETSYRVVDASTRKIIGKLDESFVLSNIFEGVKIILRGQPWRIVKREEQEILVSPHQEIGDVPQWVGEDIPIPFEVARAVGALRRTIAANDVQGYPCDPSSFQQLQKLLYEQQQKGFVTPDDHTITIDSGDNSIIINACFGTKVNETLGRLISAMLAQSLGESIGINSDAYRIQLQLPTDVDPQKIKEILTTTTPESLEYLLETILRNSTYLRWQLVHVARKFGALRKDFDFRTIGTKKLISLFDHSLILGEALDKLIWDRMDIPHTQLVLKEIQNKTMSIHIQGLSPIALSGFETIRGLMVPQRADRTILMALNKRLENTSITLSCTNCKHTWHTIVGRSESQLKCRRCGATKITVVHRSNQNITKLLSKTQPTTAELKEIKRLHKNASLVQHYKIYALIALMGRGIGPDTAARILRRYSQQDLKKSEEIFLQFLKDILKAELTYARTRGFWDI